MGCCIRSENCLLKMANTPQSKRGFSLQSCVSLSNHLLIFNFFCANFKQISISVDEHWYRLFTRVRTHCSLCTFTNMLLQVTSNLFHTPHESNYINKENLWKPIWFTQKWQSNLSTILKVLRDRRQKDRHKIITKNDQIKCYNSAPE